MFTFIGPSKPPGWERKHGLQSPWDILQVCSWVIVIYLQVSFWVVVFPELTVSQGVALAIWYELSFVVVVSCGLYAMLADVSDPMLASQPNKDKAYEARLPFCSFCDKFVQKKTKHCRVCNRCVFEFDHHCRWLNTCVGSRTYKAFLGLLASLISVSTSHLTASTIGLVNVATGESVSGPLGHSHSSLGLASVTMALDVVILGLVVHLSGFHVFLLRKGLSTYDYILELRRQAAGSRATSSMSFTSSRPGSITPAFQSRDSGFANSVGNKLQALTNSTSSNPNGDDSTSKVQAGGTGCRSMSGSMGANLSKETGVQQATVSGTGQGGMRNGVGLSLPLQGISGADDDAFSLHFNTPQITPLGTPERTSRTARKIGGNISSRTGNLPLPGNALAPVDDSSAHFIRRGLRPIGQQHFDSFSSAQSFSATLATANPSGSRVAAGRSVSDVGMPGLDSRISSSGHNRVRPSSAVCSGTSLSIRDGSSHEASSVRGQASLGAADEVPVSALPSGEPDRLSIADSVTMHARGDNDSEESEGNSSPDLDKNSAQ